MSGKSFGRLKVLYQVDDYVCPSGRHHDQWLCQCSCGSKPLIVIGSSLRYGNHTRSCGCLDLETRASRAVKLGMDYNTLYGRLRRGWSVEDALTKPVYKYKE